MKLNHMTRSTTRTKIRRRYEACRYCEYKNSEYELCKAGYENFYYRISKRNGCKKCDKEMLHYAMFGYHFLGVLEEELKRESIK